MSQAAVPDEFAGKHFVDLGAVKVCYRRAGEGPALVLLHGYPLSGNTWRKIVPELAQRFTCYAFDLVGFGHSTSPQDDDFSSQGEARVIHGALSILGVSSYALIANNSGGWIARELALLDPDRVTHLVLTNTEIPGHRPPWIGFYQFIARTIGGSFLFRWMLASRRWRRSSMGFGGCFDNPDLIDGEFRREFLAPLMSSRERIKKALRFLENMKFERVDEFADLHRKLSMPVAFVWGSADPTFPESLARDMASQFPNVAGFTSIPKGKLFIQEEFPDAVVNAIIKFLTAVPIDSPQPQRIR